MDERMRRQWAGAEAAAYGWGGVRAVAQAAGLSPTTIRKGVAEVLQAELAAGYDPVAEGLGLVDDDAADAP